jgi:Cys-tRNA(Pro)/Cys-tRNA(Cys) deacylase
MVKTNVMRLLEVAKIPYSAHEYDPSLVDGMNVATVLSQDPGRVFKSLICVNDKKEHFVFDIPFNSELDLKKAARVSNSKSMEMIPLKELLPLTGYVHGGCSPIGLKKPFPVYIDERAKSFQTIFISAGKRGFQIEVYPTDLASYCQGEFADLIL